MAEPALAPVPVAFVSSSAGNGGSEQYLERLLDEIGDAWIRTVVVLEDGPLAERLRRAGRPVVVAQTGRRAGLLVGALRVRQALRHHRDAVVHANGIKAALVCVLAGLRPVWVKHDFSWDGRLVRLIARRCAAVVAVSHAVAAAVDGVVPVRVVANGIPVLDIDPAQARAAVQALTGDLPVVAVVGRLDPVKGQLEAVETVAAIKASGREVRLLLVGEAEPTRPWYAQAVRERIEQLRLTSNVVICGWRDDARVLIAGADVLMLPTMPDERGFGREGFGLTAVEAMAAGTPVVGYADGALPEVVGDGGRLVAPGDRRALAAAVEELLDDATLRARITAAGRERAKRFDVPRMVAAMRDVYRQVAA